MMPNLGGIGKTNIATDVKAVGDRLSHCIKKMKPGGAKFARELSKEYDLAMMTKKSLSRDPRGKVEEGEDADDDDGDTANDEKGQEEMDEAAEEGGGEGEDMAEE